MNIAIALDIRGRARGGALHPSYHVSEILVQGCPGLKGAQGAGAMKIPGILSVASESVPGSGPTLRSSYICASLGVKPRQGGHLRGSTITHVIQGQWCSRAQRSTCQTQLKVECNRESGVGGALRLWEPRDAQRPRLETRGAAHDVGHAPVRGEVHAHDLAGGSLRTTTRPTMTAKNINRAEGACSYSYGGLTTILKVSRDPLCVRDVVLKTPPALSCSASAVLTAAPSLPTSVSPNTDEAHDIVRLGPFAAAAAKAKARGVGVASWARERRVRWARRARVRTAAGGGTEGW